MVGAVLGTGGADVILNPTLHFREGRKLVSRPSNIQYAGRWRKMSGREEDERGCEGSPRVSAQALLRR